MKQRISAQTFCEYRYISGPSYSPDGAYVAFICQQADLPQNTYRGDVFLWEVESGQIRQLTNSGLVKSFCWDTNGTLLYPKAADTAQTEYFRIDPKNGLTSPAFVIPLAVEKLECVGDGTYVVLDTCNRRSSAPGPAAGRDYSVFEELPFWFNGLGIISGKRKRLSLFRQEDSACFSITPETYDVYSFSCAYGRVLYVGTDYVHVRPTYRSVYLYDISQGETKCIVPDKTLRAFEAGLFEDAAVVIGTDMKHYGLNEDPQFYLVDLETLQMTLLAPYNARAADNDICSDIRLGGGRVAKAAGGRYYFITPMGDYSYLRYVDRNGVLSPLLTANGSVDCFDVYGKQVVFCGLRGLKPTELYLLTAGGERQLTGFNRHITEQYQLSVPEPLHFTNTEGIEIHGWVQKPVDYQPGTKYPAILHIHGGPRMSFCDVHHHEMQSWSSSGYFVFYCNPRGGGGRGNEFGNINGRYGVDDYSDLMQFTDHVLALYPDIDQQRVGVTGGSYGGFMTNWIIGHTNRFAAAVSQRSISNFISYEVSSDVGYYLVKDQNGASMYEDLPKIWEQSPLKYAGQAVTPTLFIHADQDYRCWMVEGISMFTALKRREIPCKLCLFHGENHELSRSGKPANRLARLLEIQGWFRKYLTPAHEQ